MSSRHQIQHGHGASTLRGALALALAASSGLVGCMGQAGFDVEDREQGAVVCPGGSLLEGIDVSYWQSAIDWSQVAADGIVYAFIRVSDGNPAQGGTYDTRFQENWAGALENGIIRGPYQFFRPSDDAVAQADLVISEIGGAMTPGDLPPVIDVEATDGLGPTQVAAAIQVWIERIETVLGVTPIIYSGKYFWQDNVQSTAFSEYPLWHAQYTTATCPNIADQWSAWAFWQYTSSGSVAGIGGNVDRNVYNGDLGALQSMTFGDPVCGDGYCTGDEDHASCPADCPVCENIPPLGRVVDETDRCFDKLGTPSYWRTEADGWASSLIWTHTVATEGEMDNHGVWNLTFDDAGEYRVEAYTDATYAQSKTARYQVRHSGSLDVAVVDQSAQDGWALVGDFQFAAGGDQWIRLEDFTGEDLSTNTQIVLDAVQLTRLDPVVEPDAGLPDGGPDAGDATDMDASTGDGGTDPDPDPRSSGGCSCQAGGSGGPGDGAPITLALLVLLGAWIRRVRRSPFERAKAPISNNLIAQGADTSRLASEARFARGSGLECCSELQHSSDQRLVGHVPRGTRPPRALPSGRLGALR